MAVVLFLIILPLVHVIPPLVTRFVHGPRLLVEAIYVAMIVSSMNYVLLPVSVRLLGTWLRPTPRAR